eukprot:93182_1
MSDSLMQSDLEQFTFDNLETLKNDNESLQEEIKRLLITLSTYEDENNKFAKEKEELIKQINYYRETSEETASSAFLKSHSLSHDLSTLKQETHLLTKKNEIYKQKLTKQISKTRTLQIKNNQLLDENTQYKMKIRQLQLSEDVLTKTCSEQSTEIIDIKHSLTTIQSKYDRLYLQNSEISKENEKLNDIIDTTTTDRHALTPDILIPITPNFNYNRSRPTSATSQRISRPTSGKTMCNVYKFESGEFNNLTLFLNSSSLTSSGNVSPTPSMSMSKSIESDNENIYENEWKKKYDILKIENNELLNKLNCNIYDMNKSRGSDGSIDSTDLMKIANECNKLKEMSDEKRKEKITKLKVLEENAIARDVKNKTYCSLCWIYMPKIYSKYKNDNENDDRVVKYNGNNWYPTLTNWIYSL